MKNIWLRLWNRSYRKNNYAVDLSYDGEYGLDCALSGIYDVIVLDIMLPKMNGLDVLKSLRNERVSTPVLLLTAKSETQDNVTGLDTCKSGEILYKEKSLRNLDRDRYRANDIGVIFQGYNLLLNVTAKENIMLSMNISGVKTRNKAALAEILLSDVGIDSDKGNRKVLNLSGDEQQRAGIARAISHDGDIIIADEPTGNLDSDTQSDILKIFTTLAHEKGKCVIIVTHSKQVTGIADVIYTLKDGRLVEIRKKNQG